MSKYNKFEDFMQTVINEADNQCKQRHSCSLADAYNVQHSILKLVEILIKHGWKIFIAVVALLVLGPIAFGISLAAFISTPIGLAVVAGLAAFGGASALRTLYKNRVLPIAVKEVGEKYKSDFNNHLNQAYYIDDLIRKASNDLLDKATVLLK